MRRLEWVFRTEELRSELVLMQSKDVSLNQALDKGHKADRGNKER
jgi:hypothetical protein